MTSIDIASFHGNQVTDKFVGGIHAFSEKGDDNGVKLLLQQRVPAEQLLVQELAQDANQFVVDERGALETGFFQPPDLLLDDQFKGRGSNEERRGRSGGVVEDGPNVDVLVLIKGIHRLDTVIIQFVEDEADTSASR